MRIKPAIRVMPYYIGYGRIGRLHGVRHNWYAVSSKDWSRSSYFAYGKVQTDGINKGVRRCYMRPRFTKWYYGMDKNLKLGNSIIPCIYHRVKM